MAVYQALLLNTVVPQIQAAQAGDSYVMVVNATTPALRITQTGTGNAISVEDEANPDATPFVVTAAGDVGIGTNSPGYKLEVNGGASDAMSLFNSTNANGAHLRFAASGTVKSFIGGAPGFLGSGTADDLGIRAVGSVLFATNGSSVDMTLDASGNLGLGVTPNANWSTLTALQIKNAAFAGFANSAYMVANAYYDGSVFKYIAADAANRYQIAGGQHEWYRSTSTPVIDNDTVMVQAMTLDASGNLLVGTTAGVFGSERVSVDAGSARVFVGKTTSDGNEIYSAWSSATSGDNRFAGFWTETSATERGSITYNRAGGLVAYNTTSDYRAKDVTGPVANSGATIDALKVYNGKMKGATVERPMLVAHEAQEVTPYAVTGEKDAVEEDGKPKYQQMDVSSLVPLLIAEIQSLRARVAQLEAK